MMIVRHAEHRDLDDIYILAEKSGVGLTSLPENKNALLEKLSRTSNTRLGNLQKSEQGYLFVLEDLETQKIVGVSGIEVAVGLTEPFYNFHIVKQVHASKALNVYQSLDTLLLSNNHTGSSELCTLFLDPEFRKNKNGKFLSKTRFMFIAAFKSCFQKKLIAEMRGHSDETGESPFWTALGHHFFNMEFTTADYLSGIGQKVFIAELMPRFPVYINLLPKEAQAVIAKAHQQTLPALHLLQSEGLQYQGYVDIFDAGPTIEANIDDLRAVKESQCLTVNIVNEDDLKIGLTPYLIANDDYHHYKALLLFNIQDETHVNLTAKQADALGVGQGKTVRTLALDPEKKSC